MKIILQTVLISALVTVVFPGALFSQNQPDEPKPPVIEPEKRSNPPSDAIILFDKGALDKYVSVTDDSPAPWKVTGRHFTVEPETGNIQTKQHFGDMQLHIEFKIPRDAKKKEGQKAGNSGIYIMGKYEVQVLNSFENETYTDGQAGAVYKQYPPMVNASLKPGKWQEYDIVFEAPEYDDKGNLEKPPFITVFHNGVLVQNHVEVKGPTTAYNEQLPANAEKGPLLLQDHNNKVSFRNIWIREL